ncbi:MAG TPA: ATPase [Methanolinea sp.]|jgi:V/A-type H+-transporting ATPase subunit G/H|nr:ATPase [Methanolinea sp.]HQI14646.1 ATPase [Methanolinea sp.]HQJ19338.1 ATPase [Methanolinea sp.]
MKTEVLQKIKLTESEYEKMISEAVAEAKRTSAHAELEADNLIMKATHDAEEYKKARMAEIRENAARRREEILKDGRARAAELRQRGSRNLEKAASLLVSRFRERLHVHS